MHLARHSDAEAEDHGERGAQRIRVYGFAKQSNGAFRIDSKVGTGTTAELWLPRAPETASSLKAPAPETVYTHLSPLTVLLVDDHAEVRSTTAAVLEDSGHQVVQASSGTEALEMMKDRDCKFDLLITDYAMPHLSGTEFLREARLICPDVPALLITGYAEAEMIGDRPEDVEVLLKPFTPTALEASMARVCGSDALAN